MGASSGVANGDDSNSGSGVGATATDTTGGTGGASGVSGVIGAMGASTGGAAVGALGGAVTSTLQYVLNSMGTSSIANTRVSVTWRSLRSSSTKRTASSRASAWW